jgi:hypothetical protein
MSPHKSNVHEFVTSVRRTKNRHRLWTIMIWALTAGAALWIAIGLCYILRGYSVPLVWAGVILAAVGLTALGFWLLQRFNVERAAQFTDRFFGLHDSITSFLHFESQGRTGGYYALQAEQTADCVDRLDAKAIGFHPPKRLLYLSSILLTLGVAIGFCPPSDAVLEKIALQQAVEKQTTANNEQLLKEMEKLVEETRDKEEEKLLNPNQLRRWVKELKTTPERTEALRQYARLEKKLEKTRQSLERKQEEQLLERAAEELAKSEETKSMAEPLSRKEYDKAAKKLSDLKPNPTKSPDQKRGDLNRLKAIAQRMAAAAQSSQSPAIKSASGKPSQNQNPSNKQGQGAGASAKGNSSKSGNETDGSNDGSMSETIEQLAESLENIDQNKDCEKACSKCVDKLSNQLKKLAICKRAECKLCKLCRCCGSCQSNMSSACSSPNAGGHKAGWGTNTARRNVQDPLIDNGQTTQLKGQKGAGPSVTTVESADSGSGASSRKAEAKQRSFQHQFESFVQREDVPEAVRDGVKQYFEIIHETDADPLQKGTTKE